MDHSILNDREYIDIIVNDIVTWMDVHSFNK